MSSETPRPVSRPDLDLLDRQHYDVAVIGGGINGASAAQELTAKGYKVLLIDAADFGSGASSKSARMMHFGLRYLDRGEPLVNYFKNPMWFIRQCLRARATMRHRAELVRDMPERVVPYTMYVPVYRSDYVSPWQLSAGLHLINLLSRTDVPAEWRRLSAQELKTTPFVAQARDRDDLQAVFAVTEHRYDWPERLVADYMLDAARMGADCRNYTRLDQLKRSPSGYVELFLSDTLDTNRKACVTATRVINSTGAWIDQVLNASGLTATRQIAGTKGVHAAIELPDQFRGQAFAHFTDKSYPFYFLPWRHLHYIGPTETHFEGDPSKVRATEDDLNWLVNQANRMLPGIGLTRDDLVYHWAGVRPMPHIPNYKGKQNLVPQFHTHEEGGFPDVLSVPGGALMMHRFTGRKAAEIATKGVAPSRDKQQADYRSRQPRTNTNSAPMIAVEGNIRWAHLQDIALEELPETLADILLRRTGLVWTGELSRNVIERAAEEVAEVMNWSPDRIQHEIRQCIEQLRNNHLHTGAQDLICDPNPTSAESGTIRGRLSETLRDHGADHETPKPLTNQGGYE